MTHRFGGVAPNANENFNFYRKILSIFWMFNTIFLSGTLMQFWKENFSYNHLEMLSQMWELFIDVLVLLGKIKEIGIYLIEKVNLNVINTKPHWTFLTHYYWEYFMKRIQRSERNFIDFCIYWLIFILKITLWSELRKIKSKIIFLIFHGFRGQVEFSTTWGCGGGVESFPSLHMVWKYCARFLHIQRYFLFYLSCFI